MPHVPPELRSPCVVEPGDYTTLKGAARVVTDLAEGLDCSNGKIVAIDEILAKAEARP